MLILWIAYLLPMFYIILTFEKQVRDINEDKDIKNHFISTELVLILYAIIPIANLYFTIISIKSYIIIWYTTRKAKKILKYIDKKYGTSYLKDIEDGNISETSSDDHRGETPKGSGNNIKDT